MTKENPVSGKVTVGITIGYMGVTEILGHYLLFRASRRMAISSSVGSGSEWYSAT